MAYVSILRSPPHTVHVRPYSESKFLMSEAGVPCVPGYHGENQDPAFLLSESKKIGFPVLIKAVKGGGGKGMRIVESDAQFAEMLASAQNEAERSFGDKRVLVEKYIGRPRHVEVQVFADGEDGYVHLFERDCSVQRRHQKIIEEAPAVGLNRGAWERGAGVFLTIFSPSPVNPQPELPQTLRTRLAYSAIAAARAVKYRGAGTVEFILDAESLDSPNPQYYFMEMNTRLQVEHPVTEMISAVDLVEWQIEVASGNGLPADWLATNSDKPTAARAPLGHAFETRIYAEDPDNNFFPSPGPLLHLRFPTPVPGVVRVETGVKEGDDVGVLYDPMIAKLVTWGRDRQEALRRMYEALQQTEIVGPGTNVEFLKRLCLDARFIEADVDTGFIQARKAELFPAPANNGMPSKEAIAAAALGSLKTAGGIPDKRDPDPWTAYAGFAMNGSASYKMDVSWEGPKVGDKAPVLQGEVEVVYKPGNKFSVVLREKVAKAEGKIMLELPEVALLSSTVDARSTKAGSETATSSLLFTIQTPEATVKSTLLKTNVVVTRDIRGEREGSIAVFGPNGLETVGVPIPEHVKQTHKMEAAGSVKTPMPCRIISVGWGPVGSTFSISNFS